MAGPRPGRGRGLFPPPRAFALWPLAWVLASPAGAQPASTPTAAAAPTPAASASAPGTPTAPAAPSPGQAEAPTQQVLVTGQSGAAATPFAERLSRRALASGRAANGDTARLLQDIPGLSLYGAGGVSSLPVIRGLADDRLRTQVDGMDLAAACPNHMNPALSYIDPSNVGSVQVYAGVTPVSVGGDSIGGTIQVESAPPRFADGDTPQVQGSLGGFWRSNGQARGGHASADWAGAWFSLGVQTSRHRQHNLRAAQAFKAEAPATEGGPPLPGDVIGSSAFDTRNDQLSLAWQHDSHQLQLRIGRQRIGFEGFPNQRMDMTGNTSRQLNLRYRGSFDGGELLARAWRQDVDHAMDMGADRYRYGFGMPMDTEAHSRGALLQATVDCGESQRVRVGAERQTYTLYDWWPAVGGTMGPNAFWNIDYGRRQRDAGYAEWEAQWSPAWFTLLGLRLERVLTDTGPVQGYDNGLGALWGLEAAAFNALDRRRVDRNLDLALITRWTPQPGWKLDLGLARKSHSPNLYQRYAWSTQPMAALMNNFVGDGNGYIGQPDLRPEVADTLALGLDRHDAEAEDWAFKATVHLTQVRDYIDARRCDFGQCAADNATLRNGFVLLQYQNVRARLHGIDLSGQRRLGFSPDWGEFSVAGVASVVRGRNHDTGDTLYNLMPANARLTLQQRRGAWSSALEWVAVAAKRRVSQVRNEIPTAGHGLLNLRLGYESEQWRIDLGLDNLLDRAHTPPLGGAYVGQGRSMTSAGIPWGVTVPGPGRGLNLSLSYRL